MHAVPSGRHPSAELRSLGALGLCWIGPWLALTVASSVAGGAPSCSPVAFIDPGRVIARVHAHATLLTPWRFVDAHAQVDAPLFWTVLAATGGALTALSVLGLRAVRTRRGSHSSRAPRRGLAPVSRWASWWDIRSMLAARPRS